MSSDDTLSHLPPGPRSATLQTLAFARDPFRALQSYARRYGDPFTLRLFTGPIVLTANPEGVREIFTAPPQLFASNSTPFLAPLAGQHSVFLLDGEAHQRERTLLLPLFHGARLQAYGQLIQDVALRHAATWQPGQAFRMLAFAQAVSLEVIVRAIFGAGEPQRGRAIAHTIPVYFSAFTAPLVYVLPLRRPFAGLGPWDRFQRVAMRLEQLLTEEIAARRRQAAMPDDILSLLLAARRADGSPMSEAEVRDELKTLLLAGHETTAIALAWAFYWLHREPDALRRLQDELRGLGVPPSPDALQRLPYLDAVCHEALRLYPVIAAITRRLKQPMALRGYTLPAGIAVGAALALIHLDPTLYPEPTRFRPERFLARKYTPYEYLPFGGGARRCLGAALAVYEMKIVLGSILAQHRLALAEDDPVPPAPRTFTIGPKGGVRMVYQGPAAG
jgi:cytochrome P450